MYIKICRTRASRIASASPAIHYALRLIPSTGDGPTAISRQHVPGMTSVNFAAAQQRVEERRLLKAAEARTRVQSRRNLQASNALTRLPFPLKSLGQRGLQAWDAIKGREGTRPAYRVGQVDAELLDEELLELLKAQVGEGLKYFSVHFIILATTRM